MSTKPKPVLLAMNREIARNLIASGKARVIGLVHHTKSDGVEVTYLAFDVLATPKRADYRAHYRVAQGFVTATELLPIDQEILGQAGR